jgi:hypothetical protein
MPTIRNYVGSSRYSYNSFGIKDYQTSFFSGANVTAKNTSTINLSEYAMIRNGAYRKLVKAYYARGKEEQEADKTDSKPKLSLMAGNAGDLSKSAQALMQNSLWNKKKITENDTNSGEDKTKYDYDWTKITNAVEAFVNDYNETVNEAAKSSNKDVLSNAVWLTKDTAASAKMLARIGVSVNSNNKLELDKDALKQSDISTLKMLFTGHNSYAKKVASRGNAIAMAAANAGGIYTSNGGYSSTLSEFISGKIDTKK